MSTASHSQDTIWEAWRELASQIHKSFPAERTIIFLLSGQNAKLQKLDSIYQTAMTAAQFGQYHRAIRYLLLFRRMDPKLWNNIVKSRQNEIWALL